MVLLGRNESKRTIPLISFAQCAAKLTPDGYPGQTVEMHSRVVGSVAHALWKRLPLVVKRMLPAGLVSLAALHDLGKISPGFQKKILGAHLRAICQELAETPIEGFEARRHAVISEASLIGWLQSCCAEQSLQAWATVLGSHHGTHDEHPKPDACEPYGGPAWQRERHALLGKLLGVFGPLPGVPPTPETLRLAAGFVCVCDWIGSDERFFPPGKALSEDELLQMASESLDAMGWVWPSIRHGLSFGDLFGEWFRPNAIQRAVYEAASEPGIFVVESLMGSGKTEAAMAGAYRLIEAGQNQGLYFALPTRLTSNRIHERLERFIAAAYGEDASVRLLHGQAWLQQLQYGGEELRPCGSWFNPSKRGLLWPFGVGTIDQALLGVINVRHNFLRAFGLAGKVVILDEVHSYDMYTGTLLDELSKMLLQLGCSVFILSATLTQARRQSLFEPTPLPATSSYPLLTTNPGRYAAIPEADNPEPARVFHIVHMPDDPATIAESVASRVAQGQAVLWIVNTVAGAQRCYRAAKSAMRQGDGPVGLLHSAFPPWRRAQLEDEWMTRLGKGGSRDTGSLLVATQIVEQSVDIDADLLVTDIAPSDMLLQRMGRVWRHRRDCRPATRPEVWIVQPAMEEYGDAEQFKAVLGPSRFVYSPYVLWRSLQVWRRCRTVTVPNELRQLLEDTYREPVPDDPAWVCDLYEEFKATRNKLRGLAIAMTDARLPSQTDQEEAKTRYSTTPTLSFLLAKTIDTAGNGTRLVLSDDETVKANARWCDFPTAKAIHCNLVSLHRSRRVPEPVTPSWLKSAVHGPVGVLRIDSDGRLRQLDGEPTELAYDNTMGIFTRPQLAEPDKESYDDELDW